jgi:hypothetical protein
VLRGRSDTVRRYLKDRAATFPDDRTAVFLPIDDPLGHRPPGASHRVAEAFDAIPAALAFDLPDHRPAP